MNLIRQDIKRLLSGFFAGGVFFCVCTQDMIPDTTSGTPRETIKSESIVFEKDKVKKLLNFSKVFSLRMVQRGRASQTDIQNMLRLLEQDPDSMQLNVMFQNMLGKLPPQVRLPAEKQYCDLAEKNPSAWIMQTFSAEILLRDKKTTQHGVSRLYRVFQQNMLNRAPDSTLQRESLKTFRETLLSRLLLLTFVHKKNNEYDTISEFIRKDPYYRKQPDLLTDWLLTSSGKRETAGPLHLLPGNVIPGNALTALRNFHTGRQEINNAISRGDLPSARKWPILIRLTKSTEQKAELEKALYQYMKATDKNHQAAYAMLGDLAGRKTKKEMRKQASCYQKALDHGLSCYDKRALHLAALYLDLRDMKNAERVLEQISRKAPKVNTTFHYISLYSIKKEYARALAKVALLPPSFIRYQQEAYIRAIMKDHQGAYRAIEKAWREVRKRKLQFRNHSFLYFSVDIAEKCKKIRMVKELLEPEIRKNPKNMDLKNTLGYILADHNTDLQRAYVLLKEVVTVEPENGAFLDSMAWVLYRLKRYEEAKKYILLALKYHNDRVLLDHAGDIFYALKDYKGAEKYWRLALRAKGEISTAAIQKKLMKLSSVKKDQ